MMPASYISTWGRKKNFDLDTVIRFVAGPSGKRSNWTALVVYVPEDRCFVELRHEPEDLRGNAKSESEEVTEKYLIQYFPITHEQIKVFKANPSQWRFIDNRNK